MLRRALCPLLAAGLLLVAFASVRADVCFYTLPGGRHRLVLQGAAGINPGGTATFTHPKFGKIHFAVEDVEIRKVPTLPQQFTKILARAGNDAEQCMEAAQWALRHGLLPQFHAAVDKALAANPNHPRATLVKKLKQQMDVDLGDSTKEIDDMRKLIGRRDMKIKLTKHFILMHDTPDKPVRGKTTRADERAQLLETVYECFLLRFYAYGVELQIPKERLKVVLFNDYNDYRQFSLRLSPSLASASGFWSQGNNTAVFFDHGTNEEFKMLAQLNKELQQDKAKAQRDRGRGAADIVRLADTLALLIEIARENSDIEVVSHEITHQMAGNTGLLPRHVQVPSWVHEGLATYFESPEGASWSGIGAVNDSRLKLYRVLAPDREHSNIDFIVGDQIFDYAGNTYTTLHGYSQAWALTHFLMEKHFDKFIAFYRRLGEMPPDLVLSQEALTQLFDEAFAGIDRRSLDAEWHAYMQGLKTDIEIILEGE